MSIIVEDCITRLDIADYPYLYIGSTCETLRVTYFYDNFVQLYCLVSNLRDIFFNERCVTDVPDLVQ